MCFEPDLEMKKPTVKLGYKVFRVKNGKLTGDYSRPRKERKRNKWLNEKDFKPTRLDLRWMGGYPYDGWRIFLLEKGAVYWMRYADKWRGDFELKVIKVKFRNILDVGECSGEPAILAKEIFIPNE